MGSLALKLALEPAHEGVFPSQAEKGAPPEKSPRHNTLNGVLNRTHELVRELRQPDLNARRLDQLRKESGLPHPRLRLYGGIRVRVTALSGQSSRVLVSFAESSDSEDRFFLADSSSRQATLAVTTPR